MTLALRIHSIPVSAMARLHLRTFRSVLTVIAVLGFPRVTEAQPASFPYSEVLRLTRLGPPDLVLREVSGGCFTFELTADRRAELLRVSLQRDPRASRLAIDAVANYIGQHPCPRVAMRRDAISGHHHRGFAAVSGDVNLTNTIRGASLQLGIAISSEFDIVGGLRFGTTENARLRNSLSRLDTASQRVGSLSVATRLWLFPDPERVTAYVQAGGVAQAEAYEAYGNRAHYTGLGILGGAGLGFRLSRRDLVFLELEGNTVWVTSRKESEEVDADYRSTEGVVLRLGFTRFWGLSR